MSGELSALGDPEGARDAAQESVEICHRLWSQRAEVFADNYSTSLWVLADREDERGDIQAGIGANAEAIRVLTPLFLRHSEVLAPKIAAMAKAYIERCEKAEMPVDEALFEPVIKAFNALNPEG